MGCKKHQPGAPCNCVCTLAEAIESLDVNVTLSGLAAGTCAGSGCTDSNTTHIVPISSASYGEGLPCLYPFSQLVWQSTYDGCSESGYPNHPPIIYVELNCLCDNRILDVLFEDPSSGFAAFRKRTLGGVLTGGGLSLSEYKAFIAGDPITVPLVSDSTTSGLCDWSGASVEIQVS